MFPRHLSKIYWSKFNVLLIDAILLINLRDWYINPGQISKSQQSTVDKSIVLNKGSKHSRYIREARVTGSILCE